MCYTLVGYGHNWPVHILWVTKSWTNWIEDCLQHAICQNLEKKQAEQILPSVCLFLSFLLPYHGHISILVAVICISLQKLCSALTAHDAHVHKLKSSLSPSKCEFEVMQFSNQQCCDNCSIYLLNCVVGDQSLAKHLATAMIHQFVITHSLRIAVVDSKRTCRFMLTEEKLTKLVLRCRHIQNNHQLYLHGKCMFFAYNTEWIKTAAFVSIWENYWSQILRHISWRKAEFCELMPSWNTRGI